MKITKRQLRRIIKEELLNEYEQYVDEEGNIYDDEGNVSKRGAAFGRKYGGETYLGTSQPWNRKRAAVPPMAGSVRGKQQKAIEEFLAVKSNNFLQSILDQLRAGKRLSDKQVAVMKKILVKNDPAAADLFESAKRSKEEKAKLEEYGGRPYDPSVPGDMQRQQDMLNPMPMTDEELLADDYEHWVKEKGHITPAASSVMATYFLDRGDENDHEKHEMLAAVFGIEHEDVMRELNRAREEYRAGGVLSDEEDYERGFHEGSMPAVWHQILGNCLEK